MNCNDWLRTGLTVRQNQISIVDFIYQNDSHNKIYTLVNFENETATHIGATHTITKLEKKF